MRFSHLQAFILKTAFARRAKRVHRSEFLPYYQLATAAERTGDIHGVLTKSLERLIDREMLVGYGRRTPHKWFIEEVRLTPKGTKAAKRLLGEQQAFRFRARKRS